MKRKILKTSLFLLIIGFQLSLASAFDHTHQLFDSVLQESVRVIGPQSQVRYSLIQQHPEKLSTYVQSIENVTFSEYQQWTLNQQKAFLINAYNALTIQLILTQYPDLDSIKDLGSFFTSPWKKKFFTLFGQKSHLDNIEHSILRKNFKEPRIHFALVCASKGCPPLRNRAFLASRLDEQLDSAADTFLQDPQRNYYHQKTKILYLSSIFKWFSEDFEKKGGSVRSFVAQRMIKDRRIQNEIQSGKIEIDYLDYDWSLNDVSKN